MKSFFAVDHDKAIRKMRNELQDSIEILKRLADAGDEKMGQLIDKQLGKLGSIENVASSLEGIVFSEKGKIYKITGAFAMANQIIGRARRAAPKTISENMIRELVRTTLIDHYSFR